LERHISSGFLESGPFPEITRRNRKGTGEKRKSKKQKGTGERRNTLWYDNKHEKNRGKKIEGTGEWRWRRNRNRGQANGDGEVVGFSVVLL
jgi:hypothetical protein